MDCEPRRARPEHERNPWRLLGAKAEFLRHDGSSYAAPDKTLRVCWHVPAFSANHYLQSREFLLIVKTHYKEVVLLKEPRAVPYKVLQTVLGKHVVRLPKQEFELSRAGGCPQIPNIKRPMPPGFRCRLRPSSINILHHEG